MLSTKFAYPLLHIKTIGEEMAVCYYFVDWNVVYEFNVIGQSFFCLLFFFGFVCPIANSPVFNFHFFVFTIYHLLLHLNLFIFRQRFELRCSTPAKCEQSQSIGFDCSFLFYIYLISCV